MSLRGNPIRGRSNLRCDLLPLPAMSPDQRRARATHGTSFRRCVPTDERISFRVSNVRFRPQPFLWNVRRRAIRRICTAESSARERRSLFLRSRRNVRRSRTGSPSDPPVRREQTLVVRNERSTPPRRGQHVAASGPAPRPKMIRIETPRLLDRWPGTASRRSRI